jgi:hypothetical protein
MPLMDCIPDHAQRQELRVINAIIDSKPNGCLCIPQTLRADKPRPPRLQTLGTPADRRQRNDARTPTADGGQKADACHRGMRTTRSHGEKKAIFRHIRSSRYDK